MIYALCIAIDNYPIPAHKLNGCVNDAEFFIAYLEGNYACEELDIKRLMDADATRANIIKGFDHFKSATADDTCLLYYCGHGSQAPSPPEFRHLDPDGQVETLVCYDSRIQGGQDLIDKEISYLIHQATNEKSPHFVAIFDCCNSGENTRSTTVKDRMAEAAPRNLAARDLHAIDQFAAVEVGGRKELTPPAGVHVQLAAARSNQTAKELRIGTQTHGVFTYNLIQILEQTNGQVSYKDLVHSLRTRIANYVNDQSPQIFATKDEDKKRYFLGTAPDSRPQSYTVDYDAKAKEWFVNAGQFHHLPAGQASNIILEISDGNEVVSTNVKKVGPFKSTIEAPAQLDPKKSYTAVFTRLPVEPLRLAFAEGNDAAGEAKISTAFRDKPAPYYELVKTEGDADYLIHAKKNELYLTYPSDDRPVFRRLRGYSDGNAEVFVQDTASVANWHYVFDIENPRTSLKANKDYEIELYRINDPGSWEADDNAPADLADWSDPVVFRYDYDKAQEKWLQPAFRMRVRNKSNRKLFFSAVNMTADYKISNKFLSEQELGPGEEAWLLDRLPSGETFKCIPLEVADAFLNHGVNELDEYMKVFVSTKQVSTDDFNQEALEMDNPKPQEASRAGRSAANHPPVDDWTVQSIQFTIVRPTQSAALAGGDSRTLINAIKVTMPSDVSATAALNSRPEATRNLAADGTSLPDLPSGWAPHNLTPGIGAHDGVNMLEFYESQGTDKVTADNPIRLELEDKTDELILPVAYDPETGLYYPVGIMEEAGHIRIDELPKPTTSGTRSLGGSIKIFFQKAVGKYIPMVYQHPQLAIGVLEQVTDPQVAAGLKLNYDLDAETLKQRISAASSIAMYIHGIIGDTTEMPKVMETVTSVDGSKKLGDDYDLLLTFDYENLNTPIEETAGLLKQRLADVGLAAGHEKTFHIVAHSMGGLVSRWFIEKLEGNQVVSHLYQLGTPNQGSPYGSLYEMATPLLANAVNGAAFLKPYVIPLRYVGKFLDKMFITLQQMNADSEFLTKLNDESDPGIPYTIIAGNTQLIPVEYTEKQNTLLKKLMHRFKSRAHYEALDRFLFKEPNDIAVSTKAIKEIPGAENRTHPPVVVECACDHISYFGDPAGLASIRQVFLDE